MRENIIEQLRHCATHFSCSGCVGGCVTGSNEPRTAFVLNDAADAIEELLYERDKYKAYFDNVSSLPDCNVCLKQSVCEFVPAWGENTRINCPLALTEPPKENTT